ncbi:MAG: sialidase family protein [Betaproteobacteria bacterium]
MRSTRLLFAACLAATLAACGGGGGSSGSGEPPPSLPPAGLFPTPDPADRVSTTAAFAPGCDGVPASGTLYPETEVEPQVATDPTNPLRMVGAWQQNRWSNGGAQGVLAAVSTDGGGTWTRSTPAFSRCIGGTVANGGDYERATDPWVAFAADGTAYAMALSLSGSGSTQVTAMLVAHSTDGGRIWSAPATLIRDSGASFFNDKNTLTADRSDARFVYAVWDRLGPGPTGPALFARTTNGGATWEPARTIYDLGSNAQTIGNLIVVASNGTLVNVFTRIVGGRSEVMAIRSTNRGTNWSAPIKLADLLAVGTRDPEVPSRTVRDGAILAQAAPGPNNAIYIVWQDARGSDGRIDAILLAKSTDAGLTWSEPVRINGDPTVAAFTPQVAVRDDGLVAVSHYDLRSNTADTATLPADYWLLRSTDGGATWSETRLAGPFDLALAPDAGGIFLGDYQGLTASPNGVLAFFAQTTRDGAANRTDVFRRNVAGAIPAARFAAVPQAVTTPSAQFAARVGASVERNLRILRESPR